MKFRILGASVGGGPPRQYSVSYVIDECVCIDAGSVGQLAPLEAQRKIKHCVLTHGHADHIATLPIFLDNVYVHGPEHVKVYGPEAALESIRRDVFNERIWPDLIRLSEQESPFLKMVPLTPGEPFEVAHLKLTPIELDHVVPTFGYIIDDGRTSVALVTDTAPTEAIWKAAAAQTNLQAVFLESSFPDNMAWLAEKAKHLTPAQFATESRKLGRESRFIAVHIKPAFHDQVVAELQALNLPGLEIGEPDKTYSF